MDVIGDPLGTTTASWSPVGTVRAPTITTPSPPAAAKTGGAAAPPRAARAPPPPPSPPAAAKAGGASPPPPTSTEPEAIASSMGGPEVKSDQFTWNGSVFSRPAALRIASAPVPFWSPTFSVTEERVSALDGDALPDAAAAGAAGVELELLDEEQAVAARPARAMAENARSFFRLRFNVYPSIPIVSMGNQSPRNPAG